LTCIGLAGVSGTGSGHFTWHSKGFTWQFSQVITPSDYSCGVGWELLPAFNIYRIVRDNAGSDAISLAGTFDVSWAAYDPAYCPVIGTVEFWWKTSAASGTECWVASADDGENDGWFVGLDATIGIYASIFLASGGQKFLYDHVTGTYPALNTWIHIRVAWTATKGYFWKNGVLLDEQTWSSDTMLDGQADLMMYAPPVSGNFVFDEFRLSKVARLPAGWPTTTGFDPTVEGRTFPDDGADTIAYYPMNEGTGGQTGDASGHGHTMNCSDNNGPKNYTWVQGIV
jgi:hypothetical protein